MWRASRLESGAQLLDVNMDEGLLDSKRDGPVPQPDRRGARLARVPIMVDSSKWEVIEAG